MHFQGPARTEPYHGSIDRFGIDLGFTDGGKIVWTVLAPSKDVPAGALAGNYAGVSAEATAGLGIGANALLGGSDKSIALQPLERAGPGRSQRRRRRRRAAPAPRGLIARQFDASRVLDPGNKCRDDRSDSDYAAFVISALRFWSTLSRKPVVDSHFCWSPTSSARSLVM